MPTDQPPYDFFVSYASDDNSAGWVTHFIDELLAEHAKFFPGRTLHEFFDKKAIGPGRDWEHTLHHGIACSHLFLAFISPNYFASDWCRKEWRAWIETEISKHILTEGVRPVYLVEVPGFTGKGALGEQDVAQKVAELCHLPAPHDSFLASAAPVVKQVRRRQLLSDFVKPFADEGLDALRREDLRRVLNGLARDLDDHARRVAAAAASESTVPPYNKKFTGRLDELLELRKRLTDDQAGVVCGVQGLGGIGKTELAFTYAHAFASAYPGGRFLVPCDGRTRLRDAALCLGDFHDFRARISDEERMQPETHFAAIARCLGERLARLGHVLLVLDNVTDPAVVSPEQTDCLTVLGPRLHLLATTRQLPPVGGNWLILGELSAADALALLEKHRSFDTEADRAAAGRIVKRLGGFALAVELVAAWLAAHPGSGYPQFADRLGLEDLEDMAGDQEVKLRRHNHERRLTAVLGPVLAALEPAERRTLEYAALLPADYVALPWLRNLVSRDFLDSCQPTRLVADPWKDLWQRLVRLALFSRPEEETTEPRLLRVHRLVQDLVRRELAEADRTARQQAVDALVEERDAALGKTTRWEDARWELEPLEALAWLWVQAVVGETGEKPDLWRHRLAAWLCYRIGLFWYHNAQWDRAEPLMRQALNIEESSFGPMHTEVASCLNNLAQLLKATSRLAEAEPLMRRALDINERVGGENHPDVGRDLANLAVLLMETGRVADAEPLMTRAVSIFEGLSSKLSAEHAAAVHDLARFLQRSRRLQEAEPMFHTALMLWKHSVGENHPGTAKTLMAFGKLFQDTKRRTGAEAMMHRALLIDEAYYGPNHPAVAGDLNNIAALLEFTPRRAEAEVLYKRAVETLVSGFCCTGHLRPETRTIINNYRRYLFEILNLSDEEVRLKLSGVPPEFLT